MKNSVSGALVALLLLSASPALAQDSEDEVSSVTVSGGATLVNDYRFRGISQTDQEPAVQGTFTISHASGFYGTVWGSSVSDYVADNSQEIDFVGGYRHEFDGTTIDVGATYYFYPNSSFEFSDFIEPYVFVSRTLGPVMAKVGVAYAPKQMALSLNGLTKRDSLYVSGDLSAGIPGTSLGLAAHVGRSFEPSYITFGEKYTDWSLGATYTWKNLIAGLSYVDTDKSLLGDGKNQSDAGVVASLGVAF